MDRQRKCCKYAPETKVIIFFFFFFACISLGFMLELSRCSKKERVQQTSARAAAGAGEEMEQEKTWKSSEFKGGKKKTSALG